MKTVYAPDTLNAYVELSRAYIGDNLGLVIVCGAVALGMILRMVQS